jgi:hypothetical protein
MKRIAVIITWLVAINSFSQQVPEELGKSLQGKTLLSDILQTVKGYYAPKVIKEDGSDWNFRQLKLWNRWALYQSYRLEGKGEITDVNRRNLNEFTRLKYSLNGPPPSLESSYGSWSFLGPNSMVSADLRLGIGRCDRITFHPTIANTYLIGTPAGGLWKTTDDGGSWTCLTNNLPTLGISGIVIDYNNTNTLYILTGDGDSNMGGFVQTFGYLRTSTGVYKSTDGGNTWVQTGQLSANAFTGFRLVQDPDESNTLLAATNAGIYRTTNGGSTWTQVRTGTFYDVRYDPNSADRVYASGNGQVLYSTNSGLNWTPATFNVSIAGAGRLTLAVTPNNAAYVYALAGNATGNGSFAGVFRSIDNGLTYTRRCSTPNIMDGSQGGTGNGSQGSYDLSLTASPTNALRILTGGVNIWSSTDGGTNMTAIMYDGSNNRKIHVDIHDLEYNPLNNNLYSANDGGLYKSTDNGTTWSKLSDGIQAGQVYHMAGADASFYNLAIGMQDNGLKGRTTNTMAFDQLGNGDGCDVALRNDNTTLGYGGINKGMYAMDLNGGLSNDFTTVDEWYPSVAVSPTDGLTVYCGYTDVYKSTNGGTGYNNKGANGSWSITTCPSNSNRVYAAGGVNGYSNDANGLLRRSDNGGDDWTTVFSSADAVFNKISCVTVDPTNSNHVWITLAGYNDGLKVFRSIDAGDNWTNVSGSLPNVPVNCIAVDAGNNAYAGTDFGVFYRGSGQFDWTPFYTGMPRVPITELVINEPNSRIRVATFGRGVWAADLYTNCVASLGLNGTYEGNRFYEASSTITSAGTISGGDGTEVFFKSAGSITLGVGFDAFAGNEFKAYIANCGNGIPTMSAVNNISNQLQESVNNAKLFATAELDSKLSNVTLRVYEAGTYSLQIVDAAGKLVKRYDPQTMNKGKFSQPLNRPLLPKGLYYLQLLLNENVVHFQEIIY